MVLRSPLNLIHKNKIKIAFIFTAINFGGSEKVNLTLLRNIDRSQFHIVPILLIRPWENDNHIINEIEKINYSFLKIPVAKKSRNKGTLYIRIIRCYKYLYRILHNASFDFIHSSGYFADILSVPISKILSIPIISTCHGFVSNDIKLRNFNKIDKFSLRFCNKIICVSERLRYDLIESGIKKSRIVFIPNVVELEKNKKSFFKNRKDKRQLLNIKENEFVLGYTGRLSEEKGLKYLIESCFMLNNINIPIKLLIIGQGSQQRSLEYLVNKLGIGNKIIFCGFQSNIKKWLQTMDVFILPSLTEGTPMALLEAMSYGIPVVASAVGDVPNLIESGKNGILVPPTRPDKIKDAVYSIYSDKCLKTKLSMNGKKSIEENYNIDNWINQIEREYLGLIKERN